VKPVAPVTITRTPNLCLAVIEQYVALDGLVTARRSGQQHARKHVLHMVGVGVQARYGRVQHLEIPRDLRPSHDRLVLRAAGAAGAMCRRTGSSPAAPRTARAPGLGRSHGQRRTCGQRPAICWMWATGGTAV